MLRKEVKDFMVGSSYGTTKGFEFLGDKKEEMGNYFSKLSIIHY